MIQIRPLENQRIVSRGRTVLCLNDHGFIEDERDGLYFYQSRVLSEFTCKLQGEKIVLVNSSQLDQSSWMAYYLQSPLSFGQHRVVDVAQQSIEIRLRWQVGARARLEISITNYSASEKELDFEIIFDGDFAEFGRSDAPENMSIERQVEKTGDNNLNVSLSARACHHFDHQGNSGEAVFSRFSDFCFEHEHAGVHLHEKSVHFSFKLARHETWQGRLTVSCGLRPDEKAPTCFKSGNHSSAEPFDGEPNSSAPRSGTSGSAPSPWRALQVQGPPVSDPGARLLEAVERSGCDLEALSEESDALVAGVPRFAAVFGRDGLQSGWQSALLNPHAMDGPLRVLARHQGERQNPWLDERPGKIPHAMQTGPSSVLGENPKFADYGSSTSSLLYCIAVLQMWRWTGNTDLLHEVLPVAERALRSVELYSHRDGDGFYEYKTESEQGAKNQGWKDSDDAIVYPDGSQVEPPIATCEQQGYVYLAKMSLAEIYLLIGRRQEAEILIGQAAELKKRFNEAFWMEAEQFIAMGLDSRGAQIGSIGSDPGHCLATGIVDSKLAGTVADRLMQPDLFSGWGVRTLSSRHPAFNPWSYHRGSVWPVEQGSFALGFRRYGLVGQVHELVKAQAEALSLFQWARFPELFAGHERCDETPFPGIYPYTCWPQAWSSSSVVMMLDSLIGTYAHAPLKLLALAPHLPEWLPRVTLRNIWVGEAQADIEFKRESDGRSTFSVLDVRGELSIVALDVTWSQLESFSILERFWERSGARQRPLTL